MFGLINLNKPAGMTSREAIDFVKRLVAPAKVGHAGTLDPLATGVLVVGVGPATRLTPYVQRQKKLYQATFQLGRRSATEDIESPVEELSDAPVPTQEQVVAAVEKFRGKTKQRPPIYSALKVNGQRSYDLARQGEVPELEPRDIFINRLEIMNYQYPELKVAIECSAGTYVRALGRDIAEAMGSCAVMSALVRLAVGTFRITEAVDPRNLSVENLGQYMRPPINAVEYLPRVKLSTNQVEMVRYGRWIVCQSPPKSKEIVAVDGNDRLVAILTHGSGKHWQPSVNFSTV